MPERPGRGGAEDVKFAVREVGDARGETEAQEMKFKEDVVAHAAAVRMMDRNVEISLLIEQPVYDVRRFA